MAHVQKKNSFQKSNKKAKLLENTVLDRLEEERLEKLVFGKGDQLIDALSDDRSDIPVDKLPTNDDDVKQLLPAWTDTDPAELVSNRTQKFENIVGKPKWAEFNRKRKDSSSDEDENAEILQHCGNLIAAHKYTALRSGNINLKRNRDLNHETYTEGPILEAVEFHRTSTVALVAGVSGIATLFQVNGNTNPKLQSIKFDHFPINCAKFSASGTEFLVGSRHHDHFFAYDMESGESTKVKTSKQVTNFKNFALSSDGRIIAVLGRFGEIHLLTARTKELIDTLQMNGDASCIAFNNTGSRLYAHGAEGKVYTWDTHSRSCISSFVDDGCLKGSSIAVSDRYLAAGSSAGAVNIYSTDVSDTRTPLKTLLHIRTPVTSLAFNASEEVLAMASHSVKNAIRLVHLPSFTVFSNFPGRLDALCVPKCIAFSPNSGYMAVGNNKSTALLFRLKHYGNY